MQSPPSACPSVCPSGLLYTSVCPVQGHWCCVDYSTHWKWKITTFIPELLRFLFRHLSLGEGDFSQKSGSFLSPKNTSPGLMTDQFNAWSQPTRIQMLYFRSTSEETKISYLCSRKLSDFGAFCSCSPLGAQRQSPQIPSNSSLPAILPKTRISG